jgi:hypothetical protein
MFQLMLIYMQFVHGHLLQDQLVLKLIPVQAFSTIDSNYTASFIVTTAQATAIQLAIGSDFKLQYSKQPSDTTRGDFEDTNPFAGTKYGTSVSMKVLTWIFQKSILEMQSEPIVAKTRKLKAVWTPEFAQDLTHTTQLMLKLN